MSKKLVTLKIPFITVLATFQPQNKLSKSRNPRLLEETLRHRGFPYNVLHYQEDYRVWQYKLWSFQTGDTRLERFLPRNQHTQRKLLNLSFGLMASCQKVPKFDLQSQFLMSKIIRFFLNFFSLKNANLGAHFLFLTFSDEINFKITLLLK